MGQLILGVAGSVVGNMILPGIGGAIGGLIGSAIGGALFAPSAGSAAPSAAPSLMDLKITGTDYGQCIPYVQGTARIAGQIWWNSDRRPTTTTSSGGAAQSSGGGGKGGGGGGGSSSAQVTVTTTTYDMDMLVGLTNNEIIGVRRIWNNGKLIYTVTADASSESIAASAAAAGWARMTVYSGAADQLPDPTYEAAVTTALACAYRGRGSVFIQGLQLGQSGQVPNLTFEVVVSGVTSQGIGVLVHFEGADGAATCTDEYGHEAGLGGGLCAISTAHAKFGTSSFHSYGYPSEAAVCYAVPQPNFASHSWSMEVFGLWEEFTTGGVRNILCATSSIAANEALLEFDPIASTLVLSLKSGTATVWPYFDIADHIAVPITVSANTWHHFALTYDESSGAFYTYVDGVNCHVLYSSINIANSPYGFRVGGDYWGLNPMNGWIDEWFVIDACRYPGGKTFTPPTSALSVLQENVILPLPPSVSTVVSDLCVRAGLTTGQIEVTGLSMITRTVQSLAVAQVAPTRQTLELLMSTYFFEMVTSDKIYFRPRGGPSLASIGYLELGASTSETPSEPLALKQANELEIPAQIAITYPNVEDDYQSDTQYSDRLISAASGTVLTVQMAIGMTPSEAKALADTMLLDQAASVIGTTIALLGDYCRMEPTDPVTVTGADGSTFRLRLVKKTDSYPLMKFDAVIDDVSVLTSQGITSADYRSSTNIAAPVGTLMELMDIPILQDSDNDPGFYVATKGDGAPYPGSGVYSSNEDVEYGSVAVVMESAVFGKCLTALGDWTGPRVIDEQNIVTVDVGAGTLASSTRDAVLNNAGVNLLLVGNEVLQFITATIVAPGIYTLSGLLRGGRSTEWAMVGHVPPGSPPAGERVVLLRGAGLRRIILQNNELGLAKYYKGVTRGRALSTAVGVPFTDNAIGLKPFSPFDLRTARDASNNITFTWQRRTRLAVRTLGSLGISLPLGEATEAYQIDIYAAGSPHAVVRMISSSFTSATYTAAQQTADGITPGDPITWDVRQMSATVLRGYSTEQTG